MNDAKSMTDEMGNLLKEKNKKLIDILEITKQQAEVIGKEDIDDLGKLIDKKQVIMDQIDTIDQQFMEKFNNIKLKFRVGTIDEIPSENRMEFKEIQTSISKNHKVVEEIIAIEKENSVNVKKRFADIKAKIKGIQGGKKIITAYGNTPTLTDGVFIDKKK